MKKAILYVMNRYYFRNKPSEFKLYSAHTK